MIVVPGKFKPTKNKKMEHLTKGGASVAKDKAGRHSLPMGRVCPWTQAPQEQEFLQGRARASIVRFGPSSD
jgi:hypothetical protein